MNVPSVVLVTGASGGIGKACAEYLAGRGFHVYGTSRRAVEEPAEAGRPVMIRMDITDSQSVAEGVRLVLEREGRLDAVVNNAGALVVGPIEDVPIAEIEKNVQTNCLGAVARLQGGDSPHAGAGGRKDHQRQLGGWRHRSCLRGHLQHGEVRAGRE